MLRAMSRLLDALMISYPTPGAPNSSAPTTIMRHRPMLVRKPLTIDGDAAGRTTCPEYADVCSDPEAGCDFLVPLTNTMDAHNAVVVDPQCADGDDERRARVADSEPDDGERDPREFQNRRGIRTARSSTASIRGE